MQKTNSKSAVRRAVGSSGKTGNTGKAGKAGKARKQLTPEQREWKRLADRARRRRIRQAVLAEQANAKQGSSCCGKGCTCGRSDRSGKAGSGHCCGQSGSPVTAVDVAVIIGKHVAMQVASAMPGREVVGMSELQEVEPGVTRGKVAFSNGSKAIVTFVDGNVVDPLSEYSPLPPLAKRALLRARIAREVSDLVDAHAGMESLP
jgi:hypothetical protein